MKKKAYVVGSNTSLSLSPLIFNYWLKKANINAEYEFREINPKNFNNEIKSILLENNICGINVTIPFKEKIIGKINNIDIHSKAIGAVNCLTRKNNVWVGGNTDWIGFTKPLLDLQKRQGSTQHQPIVIGYGGAAKAVIYALKKLGYKEIKIFNRTYEKIEHLNKDAQLKAIRLEKIEKHLLLNSLIINTTPENIFKKLNINTIEQSSIGYDIVYNPKETMFLSNFKKENRIYGINMLIYQAVPCFQEWFGGSPTIDKELYTLIDKQISQ